MRTVIVMLLGVFMGVILRENLDAISGNVIGQHPIRFLSEEEFGQTSVLLPIHAAEIRLLILSKEDFEKRKVATNFVAWSDWYKKPCEVFVNADDGHMLLFPKQGRSVGQGNLFPNIAHEIGHCLYGPWHRGWTSQEMGMEKR